LPDFNLEKKRILCVEDDQDTCELLTFLLSDYQLIFADTIKKSLDLFKTEHFDLCLLDNRLSDGHGTELCRQIRALNSSVPIIFVSGVAYEEEIQKAIDAGAQAYLVKPYSLDELLKVVKELTDSNK
jgi:DNA-binding response OmpR family regulator